MISFAIKSAYSLLNKISVTSYEPIVSVFHILYSELLKANALIMSLTAAKLPSRRPASLIFSLLFNFLSQLLSFVLHTEALHVLNQTIFTI